VSGTADIRANYFPLYPWLTRVVLPFVRIPLAAALVVANVCFLIALFCLWELVRIDWGDSIAQKAIWLFLLFPTAIFLSGAYSESVLLATTVSSLLAARRHQWRWAGALAALATLSRAVGIVALAPVIVEYASNWSRIGRPVQWARDLVW